MESLRFFSNVPPGGSNVSLSGTTLTIGDETHTLADPATVASNDTAIANLQGVQSSITGDVNTNTFQISSLSSTVSQHTTDIATANTNVATNTSAISSLQSVVEGKSTVLAQGVGGSTLNNITIDGTAYQLGGGTSVVANPSTAATTDLTKLTVGSTTYEVPTGTRNYQYDVITATNSYTTSSHNTSTNPTWTDVTDISISITPTRNDSPMRIQAHFFGEVSTHDGDLKFRFKRVQGGTTTYVKHSNDLRGTLSVVGHDSSGVGTTQQPWQIIAFDSNDSSDQITYTLQIADHGGGTFYLNRTQSTTDEADRELLNSTIEVEEILTGLPLQVNSNVVPINPTNGHFIQWNGSAYTTALPILDLSDLTDVSTTAALNGDSLIYSSLSSQWMPQRAASQFGLPAGNNAKLWVVAGESISRVGNYTINHVGTGRTFNYDGDGHLYLNHSNGANYLQITDSNAMINFKTSSYTFAVVVDLSLQDGGSGGVNYGQTMILQYDTPYTGTDYKSQAFYFANQNNGGTPGTFGIDYYFPGPAPFMHTPTTSSFYEGKALIVVTYQNTSTTSQTVTIYKNGTQVFTNTSSDILSSTGTNTEWLIAGTDTTNQGGFQTSKFYAAAVWNRVLTTDEIGQLSIDKLVTKRQTMPVSDLGDITNVSTTAPTDGQVLVFDSGTSQWIPSRSVVGMVTSVPTSADPEGTLKYYNGKLYLRVGSNWEAFSKDP
jgi:hypothetical protein